MLGTMENFVDTYRNRLVEARRAILCMHRIAAKKYANGEIKVGGVAHESRGGILGLFQDEIAQFTIYNPQKKGSAFAGDTISYDIFYSAAKESFSIKTTEHVPFKNRMRTIRSGRSGLTFGQVREYLDL